MVNNLSKREISILKHLEGHKKLSLTKIGKLTRNSQQQVSYTLNSLIKKDLLHNFYTLIDYSIFGVLCFRVYFQVNFTKEFNLLIEALVRDPYTSWIATCGSDYDLIVTFFANNPSHFNKKLHSIINKYSTTIKGYALLTTIVMRFFDRKYIYKTNYNEVIFGGDRKPIDISSTELKVLSMLSANARINYAEAAEKLNLTPKTVLNKIQTLERKKIILGHKALLNLQSIGLIAVNLLIKYHNISIDLEDKLFSFLKFHKNITAVIKTLGEWDLEIKLEVKDLREYRSIEIEIREKFAPLIQGTKSIPIYHTYKKNFFPEFLIQ